MAEKTSLGQDDRKAMMQSMMEQFFGGMSMDEKKDMCATMMAKMTEDLDMAEMMPQMMMAKMSGAAAGGPQQMHEKMSKMMGGGDGGHMAQMPEMMLTSMMPHCIGMMLPVLDADKRAAAAAAIVAALVDKGTAGMTDEQAQAFRAALKEALGPAA